MASRLVVWIARRRGQRRSAHANPGRFSSSRGRRRRAARRMAQTKPAAAMDRLLERRLVAAWPRERCVDLCAGHSRGVLVGRSVTGRAG